MTRNWAEMRPEEFEPPKREFLPVDTVNVEGDLAELLFDHVCDYFEPVRLDGKNWKLADHETHLHPREDCPPYCGEDLILRREEDGLMVTVEITVSVSRYYPPEPSAG